MTLPDDLLPQDALPEDFGLDLLTAELRGGVGDARAGAEALARRLTRLLPHHAREERARSLLGADRGFRALTVTLGEDRYRLALDGPHLTPSRTHRVGGIDLRTEALDIHAWLAALGVAIRAEARHNRDLRERLNDLTRTGGTP